MDHPRRMAVDRRAGSGTGVGYPSGGMGMAGEPGTLDEMKITIAIVVVCVLVPALAEAEEDAGTDAAPKCPSLKNVLELRPVAESSMKAASGSPERFLTLDVLKTVP